MPDIKTIGWKELPGNKFGKGLDSAMASEDGCLATARIKLNQYSDRQYCNVLYDREYLLTKVVKFLIRPLSVLGKEKIDEVVNDAWALYCKQSIDPKATL